MIARWPWGNYWTEPDEERLADPMPCDVTIEEVDDDEPALLGPDGEPLPRPAFPFGFTSARPAAPTPEETP